ncbi:MAG: glucosamine-6-phosphate deaminase [Planctomycetota bacterium]
MRIIVAPTAIEMGRWVASRAAADLRAALASRQEARLVVATGASQFEVLKHLVREPEIDWSRVDGFHLDEYVGLSNRHDASFCRYLKERFVDHVPIRSFHYLNGDRDPQETLRIAGEAVAAVTVDVALIGIGENGHLAFNDPPADFATTAPYLLVELDTACRQQQVGEGWFPSLDDVPTHAISMSVQQILQCRRIYCSVPDERKSLAVRRTLMEPIGPECPATKLREHSAVDLVLDRAAASQIPDEILGRAEILE